MTQQRTERKKGGFTMVELIVTLVIMGILFAIAVPNLTGYIHLSQFRKNESYAKTMYLSAESSLTYYRTGGEWETFSRKVKREGALDRRYDTNNDRFGRIYGIRLEKGEYAAGNLDGDAALVAELLENDTYDKSVLNAAICIEIDVTSGQVYSVFYGTACDGLYYESNAASKPAAASGTWLDMDRRDYDTRRAERLGYYSVDDVTNVVNLDMTKLKITSINLVNSETLSLNWSSNSKSSDKDVRYQICFYNNENKQLLLSMEFKPIELNGSTMSLPVRVGNSTNVNYTFPLEYDQTNKRFSLTLDAMMNAALQKELESNETAKNASSTSITRFGGALEKPLTIYATIQAFPNEDQLNPGDEYQPSTVVTSNTANSMFGDGTNSTSCEVAAFRHLSNIRYMDENETRTFAVTAHALDWNSDSVRVYQTGDHGTLPWLRGSETAFPSIPKLSSAQSLDGNSGVLNRIVSVLTGGNTISNLKLDEDSVADGSEYLGLFQRNEGSIINLKLANPSVKVTSSTLKGAGAVCGFSSGSLKDSEVTGAAVDVNLSGSTNAQGIGGFVGVAEPADGSSKINNLGTSGSVTGVLPASSNTHGIGGIGGIVGKLVINGSYPAKLQNEANVTGNRTVGGVVGYAGIHSGASGNKAGQDISNCTNEGLVLSSADAGTEAQGKYIGGIVGYAYKTSFGSCTSRAGYANGYQYKASDESKLRGWYVGGIMGYSNGAVMYNCSTKANGYVLGGNYVGGIVGGTSTTSQQVFLHDTGSGSSTKVTTNASYVVGRSYVGGIVGINQGNSIIENCVNTGVVAGYGSYIGGICGANMSDSTDSPTILNCASYVSDTHNKIYDLVTGWGATGSFAGGLTGYNSGVIKFDDKAAVSTRSVAGIVVGKNYVGGVIGFNDEKGTINVDYKLIGGRVRATGDCAGGLVGLNASTELLEQTLTIQPSSVQGRYYVGGAIGANVVNPNSDITVNGLTVNNSLGTITAEAYCGGLIGYQRTYTAENLGGKQFQEALSDGTLLPGIQADNVPGKAATSLNNNTITITAKGNSSLKTASNNMTIRAYAYAGGIVGYCESQTKMYVKDCLNAGGFERPTLTSSLSSGVNMETYLSVQGYAEAAAALRTELAGSTMCVSIIGGVVGVNGANHVIDHCGNTGTMNGLDAMGGVVGLNEGLVTGCTLSGSMGSATQDCIGGIAGLNVGKAVNKTYGTLNYEAGTITGCVTEKDITVTGKDTVGGIVGCNIGYSDGSKTIGGTVKDNRSSANVSGASRVGGIAGENGGAITLSSTPAGKRRVNGSGSGVGGVIGVNTATGQLEASGGAAGEVIAADSKLTVQGDTKVGGIVGINRGQLGGTSIMLTSAAQVRASNGGAGGVVGAQEGTGANTILSYAKNIGQVTANKGAAGGIVAINGTKETAAAANGANVVQNCIGLGTVTSNDGYAGGVVSENYGTVHKCTVGNDSDKTGIISRNVEAAGAICAVNHAGSTVSGSALGSNITISGGASILGAVVGDNYGTVSDTTLSGQPEYDVSANALTIGGAVGRNSAGGTVKNVNVSAEFTKFSKYRYLGGVVGQNCAKASDNADNTEAGVLNCTYSGTIDEGKSAIGNCYGGIVGLNRGELKNSSVSKLTITAAGVYTATSTSSAEEKERLSSHIGGIAGKNEQTGMIMQCYIDNKSSSWITVGSGMVGGVTGYNKGTITQSGDKSTETLMKNVTKVSELLANAKAQSLSADTTWVAWQDAQVENMRFNGNGGKALKDGRTMQIIVSSNGNLGGVAGYNAPTGELSRCVSGSWLLVNKSDSISVGTGGIVGMNESEKDLSFLLNRAFVGRQLKKQNTSRFAGGIIGTQSNKTTSDWTIENCINYGTVYGYLSHYSGGIVGQWTNNGGTVENCYNYGNLQTTYAANWVGASGGIVAQLYHAASGQDFNILSCQNHGSIYGRSGNNVSYSANDSAGILGNITAYRAEQGYGQKFNINVVDCVNGPGVKIYSASMASGIVGFFSTDGVAGSGSAEQDIGNATENIVLNIDRCRNYASTLSGINFTSGIFGDRYVSKTQNQTGAASENTYIQNSFSVINYKNQETDGHEIISAGNNRGYRMVPVTTNVAGNYYFSKAWMMSGDGAVSIDSESEVRRGGSRMILFADLNNEVVAVRGGPAFGDVHSGASGFQKYCRLTNSNTTVEKSGDLVSWYNGSQVITGHVLFRLPNTGAYKTFAATYQSDQRSFRSAIRDAGGALNDMDDYVRTYYREFEHDTFAISSGKQMSNDFTVDLKQDKDGSFNVSIKDDTRPLYYLGEVEVNGQTVLTNLRFIPNQKGQGLWNSTFDGTSTGYGSGITTGTFQLPESLAAGMAGMTVTLKVRAVSLFEDTAPSDEVLASTNNVAVLPQPDVSLRLYWVQTEGGTAARYKASLNNYDAYEAFNNWKVTLKLGSQTKELNSSKPTVLMNGENIKELIVTATAEETGGIQPAAVTQTIPTDTPSSPYTPDGKIKSLDISYSGSTVDDFTITASLTVNESTMDTPPIYRIEVIGDENGKEIVFAYADVLTAAGNAAAANFTNLPEQYFAGDVTNRRVRAWYAASGLGPVYTYGDTEMAVYPDNNYHAEAALTYRTYDADGTSHDKTVYSFVVKQENHFGGYIKTANLNIKPLAAPELIGPEKIVENGSMSYKFSWTQPNESGAHYTVKLTGIVKKTDSDGKVTEQRIGIPTAEVYTNDTDTSFTINADDWHYTQVELVVTRVGTKDTGQVGLSAKGTYDVQQRLERPGQPSVTNTDTNELVYTIGWSAISDQTGCGQYRIYVQPQNGTAVPLGDPVEADTGTSHYTVERNLEPYAGQTITIYLVAEAADSSGYANSPNGISYTMTVPTRINQPQIDWKYKWNGTATTVSASDFANGGLTVTVTPKTGTNSVPPGGSTYLLKATIIAADGSKIDYPENGSVLAMAESDSSYICDLTELSTKYAGCKVTFEARISQSAGQVSSAWVSSGQTTLPKVRLPQPTVTTASYTQPLTVMYGAQPQNMESRDWTAQLTTLSWPEVDNADTYEITLTNADGSQTVVRADLRDTTKIEVKQGSSWKTIEVKADDWYTVTQGSAITESYSNASGSTRWFRCTLDTRLTVDGKTITLCLPNAFSMTTHEAQTLQMNRVQVKTVQITAQSDAAERYVTSEAAIREF